MQGISIIVCCHNSSGRLPSTLAHLHAQLPTSLPWEVVVVDNASTDGTADLAVSCWTSPAPAPLRVQAEPNPGLVHARRRGVACARYDLLSFVDDDNRVCPHWVAILADLFANHPEIGACGSISEGDFEGPPPAWIDSCSAYLAITPPDWGHGDVTAQRTLWGAGLTVRRAAWWQVETLGLAGVLTGRQGAALSSGEDTELCLALRLLGWRLWSEPSLTLRHYMPASRMQWSYLRSLLRASGASTPHLDPFYAVLNQWRPAALIWQWQALRVLRQLARSPLRLLLSRFGECKGDPEVLELEAQLGRLSTLLRLRGAYATQAARLVNKVKAAPASCLQRA